MIIERDLAGISGLILITPQIRQDQRGFFLELFRESAFREAGIPEKFVQDNISSSFRGVVRGLHFQTGLKAQAKLVTCLSGSIFDVAVDLRPLSPTLGKVCAMNLDSASPAALFIPAGFAHGFQCLSDQATVFYKCDREYAPGCESGIRWNDPDLSIAWPLEEPPILSDRDAALPFMRQFIDEQNKQHHGEEPRP